MASRIAWGLIGILTMSLLTAGLHAQEEGADSEEDFRGRLPAYFAEVVTEQQKTQIYAIQRKYKAQETEISTQIDQANELLKQLREQLNGLQALRNAEIEGLLSPEQLAEVRKKMEENLLRRLEELKQKSLKINSKPQPDVGE